jgi:hypothetical protein
MFSIIGTPAAGSTVTVYSPNTGTTTGTVSNSGVSGGVFTPHGTVYPA